MSHYPADSEEWNSSSGDDLKVRDKEIMMFNQFFRNRLGQNRGGNRPGAGPSGNCVCPQCGHKEPHQVGVRCFDIACPKCGTKMIRE